MAGIGRLIGEAARRAHLVFREEDWVYGSMQVPSEGEIAVMVASLLTSARASGGPVSSGRIVVTRNASGGDGWSILLEVGKVPMTPDEVAVWGEHEDEDSSV